MSQNRSRTAALLFIVLLGVGCATANRESSANEVPAETVLTEAELAEQLTGDQPSAGQLRAFEVRAQQKLRDFTDYLAIVADPTLDSAFRAEAQRQAARLFASEQVQITLSSGSVEREVTELRDFLDLARTDTAVRFTAQEASVYQALTRRADDRYTGELVFSRSLSSELGSNTTGYAQVVLQKVTKRFGEEEEQVWEVFLGDIR